MKTLGIIGVGALVLTFLATIVNAIIGLILTFKASVLLGVLGLFITPVFAIEGLVWLLSGYDIAAYVAVFLGLPV